MKRLIFACATFTLLFLPCQRSHAQQTQRYIELEVLTNGDRELGLQQKVSEILSEVGADRVQLRSARNSLRPSITEDETGRGITHVRVVGVLERNSIRFEGRSFSIRDADGLRNFIQALRDDGANTTLAEKKAFGLTSEQLVTVYEQLSGPVAPATAGQPSSTVVAQILRDAGIEISINREAQTLLNETPVLEEFQGLSGGTALAGILRPLGLVLTPQRQQGRDTVLTIVASGQTEEHWPVGWPIEKAPIEVEPRLFEKLDNVNINDFGLKQSLDAIQGRIGVPILYDQNGIARAGLELEEIKVTLNREGKTMYYTVLRKLANQTRPRLTIEIRKDENDKPFVWISPAQ